MNRRALYGILALALVLVMAAPIASASTPNGWTTHTGPDYELYISPYQQVGSIELTLVVNYGDNDMTLRVSHANATVSSVVIAPHASRFVQLDYPHNGTYQVTLASAGSELLTLSKQRIISTPGPTPTPTPTPPDDDNWWISPPSPPVPVPPVEPGDALTYTQAAVDALIASVTLEILLITAAVMGVMVVAGALVQRKVRFIYPTDLVTLLLLAANVWLVAFVATGRWDVGFSLWYIVPELVGYFIGYIIGARNNDWMLQYISPRVAYTYRVPIVIYEHDGRQCIADQNNRALVKRVLFGIHHEIESDVFLEPNWTDDAKYRLFPAFRRRMVNIESMETTTASVPLWWKFRAKKFTTKIEVAYGSQATAAELVTGIGVLERLRARANALEAENVHLETDAPRNVAGALVALMRPSYEQTTLERIEEFMRWEEQDPGDDDEGETEPAPEVTPA